MNAYYLFEKFRSIQLIQTSRLTKVFRRHQVKLRVELKFLLRLHMSLRHSLTYVQFSIFLRFMVANTIYHYLALVSHQNPKDPSQSNQTLIPVFHSKTCFLLRFLFLLQSTILCSMWPSRPKLLNRIRLIRYLLALMAMMVLIRRM